MSFKEFLLVQLAVMLRYLPYGVLGAGLIWGFVTVVSIALR